MGLESNDRQGNPFRKRRRKLGLKYKKRSGKPKDLSDVPVEKIVEAIEQRDAIAAQIEFESSCRQPNASFIADLDRKQQALEHRLRQLPPDRYDDSRDIAAPSSSYGNPVEIRSKILDEVVVVVHWRWDCSMMPPYPDGPVVYDHQEIEYLRRCKEHQVREAHKAKKALGGHAKVMEVYKIE